MHELGLATAILDSARHIAGGRPLRRVAVSAGGEQAISADSLAFGFEVAAAGTDDAGATLEVRIVDGSRILVDEVEVGGDRPEVLRREVVEVASPPHDHDAASGDTLHRHPAWS
ncbi:MAG: hydrogenase/urease maturation nickel metallochaperone HypA [Candidatus Dormibacteria bacterium]